MIKKEKKQDERNEQNENQILKKKENKMNTNTRMKITFYKTKKERQKIGKMKK